MITEAVILLKEKGITELLGLSIIKRLILSAGQAGLKYIILLAQGQTWEKELVQALATDRRINSRGIKVNYISAAEVETEENISRMISGPAFWLISGEVVLSERVFNGSAEANKKLEQPLIFTTGKESKTENARPEANLVLCPSSFWPALVKAWKAGQWSLTDEVKLGTWLIEYGAARLVSLPEGWLVKVDSSASRKEAVKLLLQSARKPQDGFIARHINRRISLFFTRFLAPLRVKPSILSVLNFLIGLSAAVLCALGKNYWYFLVGGFLFEFSSIFDGCDGEVARLTYNSSEKGGLLDVVFDALTYILFFSGLAVGLYRQTKENIFLWLLGLFLTSIAWYYFNLYHLSKASGIGSKIYLVAKEVEAQGQKKKETSVADRLAAKLAFALRRDFFATMVFLLLALKLSKILLVLVTMGALVESVYVYFFRRKKIKDLYYEKQNYYNLA